MRARVAVACAGVERLLGRHTQARARLESALRDLPDPGSREAVALMLELASDCLLRMEYAAISDWAVRAAEAAERLGDPVLQMAAHAMQALAAAMRGAIPEAQGLCDGAAERIDALADEEVARSLDSLVHLATAEMYTDRFEASGRHAERALAVGRSTGQGELFPLIYPMLGTALWVQGRVAEASRIFDDAVEAARMRDNAQGLAWHLFNRSFTASFAGDAELAFATASESMEIATHLDDSLISAHAAWALALALLETGKAQQAADLLLASTGGAELRLIPGGWRAYGLELLTRCFLEAGRTVEAEAAVAAATRLREAVGLPMAAGIATRAAAALSLARGDPAAAAAQPRRHWPPRWHWRMPDAFSTRPSRERSPGARWRRPASATSLRPSWRTQPLRSRCSAARATRPPPSASCASSVGESIAPRGRARRTSSACSR